MTEIVINKERYECPPAVAAYIKQLEEKNNHLSDKIQSFYKNEKLDLIERGRFLRELNDKIDENAECRMAVTADELLEFIEEFEPVTEGELAARLSELEEENARLEESFQRATGEIAADPLPRHGRWIFKERNELVPTGEFGVAEGHHVHLSAGATFKPNEKGVVVLKEHKRVKKPYCSECGDHGDDEFDATPLCPNCGAIMDGGAEE